MEIAEKTDTCAHPPCQCPASSVGGYCSEYCENAEGEMETECKCGHPECS